MPNTSQDVNVVEFKSLTLGKVLGRGAFGTVFKAKHKHWRTVAVKVVYTRNDLETGNESILRQEATMMNQLNCDCVVRLLGIVLEPGNYCLVVQYMRYGGLADFLTKLDIPWPLRFRMAYQIILGMNYLHHMNPPVIHRDLKADNILVDDAISVKIADLGLSTWKTWRTLSKLESRQRGEQPQHERQRIGTISHVAPECLEDPNRQQNEKTDIYSFGIVLWEILSRERVYSNALNSMTLAFGIVGGKRPDLQLIPHDRPRELFELMKKCWDQKPDCRPDFTGCMQAIETVYETSFEPDVDSAVIWTKQELQKTEQLDQRHGRGVYAQEGQQEDNPRPPPSAETTMDQPPTTDPYAHDGEPPTISQTVRFEGQGHLNEAVAGLSLSDNHSESLSDSSLTVDAEVGTPSPPPADEKKCFPTGGKKEKPATGATGATPVRPTDEHDISFNVRESPNYTSKGKAQDSKGASAQEEGNQHPTLTSRGKGAKTFTERFTSPVEASEKNTSIPTTQQYAVPPRPQAGPFYPPPSGPSGHGQYLPAPGGYWYTPAPGMQPVFIPQGFPMPSWPQQQGGGQGQNPPIFYQKQGSDGSTMVVTMGNVEGVQIGDKNVMYVGGAQGPRSGGRHHPVRQGNITYRGRITESTRKVETRDIQAVQEGIGKHWKALARKLGFLEGKVDSIDHDFDRDGLDEKVYQMLRKWSMEWGREATLKALADALCAIGKADVAALLKD